MNISAILPVLRGIAQVAAMVGASSDNETIRTGAEILKAGSNVVDLWASGNISDEEAVRRWDTVSASFNAASDRIDRRLAEDRAAQGDDTVSGVGLPADPPNDNDQQT